MLSTGITIFTIVLAGAMVAAVLRPLLLGFSENDEEQAQRDAVSGGTTQQNRALDVLWNEKQRVLRSIRDLDLDYDMGKLVDDTYASQRVYLIRLYVAISKRIDELQTEVNAQQVRVEAALAAFRKAQQRS
jgi:hypothetical protein